MARRVNVGQEFEADAVLIDTKVRRSVAYVVLGLGVVFLVGAALLGLYSQNWNSLEKVWSVLGPIYGGVAGYYLRESSRR
jgi:hypothetical protein